VLVTGGSGGIGAACLRLFAAEGARVVVHYLPPRPRARRSGRRACGRPGGPPQRGGGGADVRRCGSFAANPSNAHERCGTRLDGLADDREYRGVWSKRAYLTNGRLTNGRRPQAAVLTLARGMIAVSSLARDIMNLSYESRAAVSSSATVPSNLSINFRHEHVFSNPGLAIEVSPATSGHLNPPHHPPSRLT
jgi:hypothetical protein